MEYKDVSGLKEVKEPKLVLKSFDPSTTRIRARNKKVATVYLEDPTRPGPFGNKEGDLFDEFAWRRSNSAPTPSKVVKEFISPILNEEGIDGPFTVRWSRYAGCKMCPCSPGYSVSSNQHYYQRQYHVWLGWE